MPPREINNFRALTSAEPRAKICPVKSIKHPGAFVYGDGSSLVGSVVSCCSDCVFFLLFLSLLCNAVLSVLSIFELISLRMRELRL